ncbi:MAG: electron transfer flavoprotein subunit beta/FixA family protein [Bacteroidaceae bacterium]|jgi:electron transfer flavoprotein beta subunit|nr:electron transfer flavoprotein subunit beta/FixA family protein [Bacteroidaceae bacterium]
MLKIIVLAKQVPDTRNVGPEAMTPEGTVNRAALPAVFNPEDLNALEQAIRLKEQNPGSTITMLTMGLPKAADVLREGLYRGADNGILLTDRALGGADTLATSYTLAQAIKKVGEYDIILCGRQAIDGDTAQVGPQVAEKLGLTQITYTEEILECTKDKIVARRHIDGGVETVEAPLPIVVTVNGSAAPCRSRNVKRIMANKKVEFTTWGAADIDADPTQIGKAGSPTNVKAVKSIVFKAKETKTLTSSDEDINNLMKELIESNTIG